MTKNKQNKIITDAKKRIKEEKKKIKEEKKAIRKRKRERFKRSKFGKTKLGRFLGKIFFISNDKNNYTFSDVSIITAFSLIVGFFTCFSLMSIITGGKNIFKLTKDLGKFYDVYDVITDNYNGTINKNELIDAAIDGMVSSVGDTYTTYNDINETNSFNQLVKGTYDGIGCTITKVENGIKVIEVYDNSPAEKAGLKADDVIVKVDNQNALELGTTKLADYIKNEANKKIKVEAIRDKENITFTIEKNTVEIPSIVSKTFEKNDKLIGYLGISIFSSVTDKQFEKELLKLEEKKIDALIIDVRGNNGGYLTCVKDIASLFLSKGSTIYQVEKDKKKDIIKDKTAAKRTYPVAVLQNNGSASASEILAAAIKESYKGFIVGTKSYGKGTVQQVKELSDGSMVKYTIENWLTPDGNWINDAGIEPTDEIVLNDEYFEKPSDETDNQLQKALELVSK